MKRFIGRRGFLLCLIQMGWLTPLSAQNLSLDFIYGGIEDTESILQQYLKPYANIIGSDLNAGWYNTARPHKLGGLDITATVSWARAPVSALTYDMSHMQLNGTLSNHTVAPTIAGEKDDRPELTYSEQVDLGGGNFQEVEYANYTVPNGTGVDFFPLPMGQLTVGLPLGTDVSARFIPLVEFKDYGKIGLWGVGGKHAISQWIPFIKDRKFLDISLQGGYTKVTSAAHVVVEPLPSDLEPDLTYDWDDQFVVQKVQGWTVNLIASQTVSVLTFYQGIGYASSLVEILLEGHFPIPYVITQGDDVGQTTYDVLENPISMKYENFNNLRLNVGARLKLSVFTIHYDFTHTFYATHSVGIGVSFR